MKNTMECTGILVNGELQIDEPTGSKELVTGIAPAPAAVIPWQGRSQPLPAMNIPQIKKIILSISLPLVGLSLTSHADRDLEALNILEAGYPRAFFFRKAENIPEENPDFATWEANMSRLMGIMGKSLDEEVLGRQLHNPAFFTRFKKEHPDQVVLLHLNGNARDPRFEADNFFAGHWVYRQPAEILEDVTAETGESVIKVSDVSRFRVNMGRYANRNDDIALFRLKEDGTYDWFDCEQVQLVSIDAKNSSITVKRGQYGTRPRSFQAGTARAVAHEVEGPWGKNNNIMWFYNYSVHCPRDRDGKVAADRYLEDLVRWFGSGGLLEAYDGLEFDVLFNETRGDTNGDGIEDKGIVDGINGYGIGVAQFLQELRKRMGNAFIIQADGALGDGGSRSQRGWAYINGIESEGWPDLRDNQIHDWSGGLNRQLYANAFSAKPLFTYINHKFNEPVPGGNPGDKRHPDIGWNIHRLVFAAACFTDSALCYSFAPPPDRDGLFGIWDELRCGTRNELGWLGQPIGEAVHLVTQTSDLISGKPLQSLVTGSVVTKETPGGLLIEPRGHPGSGFSFSINNVPANGRNLVVFMTMKGGPMRGYPDTSARFTRLEVSSGLSLTGNGLFDTGMRLRGGEEIALDRASGARCTIGKTSIAGDLRSSVSVHPPYRGGVGYTYWTRDVTVPEASNLHYSIGMGPKSPERSDGVWFSVHAATVEDGKVGPYTKLQESSTKEHKWIDKIVSLKPFAGQTVRLKFVADCGPDDNSTTDHANWSDVFILGEGENLQSLTPPEAFMTWTGSEYFKSSFYYRDIRSNRVNLGVHIEGTSPVILKSISVHTGIDAMYRLFENGLVVANPGNTDVAFNLEEIAPGRRFRRFTATSNQDTVTNDGSRTGKSLILGPRDALFLVNAD